MARDLVVVTLDVEPSDVSVDLHVSLPQDVQADLDESARLRAESMRANREAAERARAAARRLSAMHLTVRDVGAALGVSHQRAQQLIKDGVPADSKKVANHG